MTIRTEGTGRLSDAQRAMLTARLRRGRGNGGVTAIPRRDPDLAEIPLSHGQEQLWFIDQLAPGRPTYNIAGAVRMTGRLNADVLESALDAVRARHEILRTRLVTVEGQPYQVIDQPRPARLPTMDLTLTPAPDRDRRWRQLAQAEATRGFALDQGPLFRTLLMRLADEDHVLLIAVHHTVFDGLSFPVLLRELVELYEAGTTGRPADLPELPVQYADYAVWEREHLRGAVLGELVDYWREAMASAPVLQLPTDRPRPLVQTYEGATCGVDVDSAVFDGLTTLGRREGATLYMTLLAAFGVLLHRYSGQDDIVVGTVSANRTRPELASLVGYLINTLPVRVDLAGDPTFVELLQRIRAAVVAGYAHQDLPFARMVDALRVPRDPSRSPLFQVGFNLAVDQRQELRTGVLAWAAEELESSAAKFDLQAFAIASGGRLTIKTTYATALYGEATVRRLLGHFQVLLAGIVADPGQRLSRLPLLPPDEVHREIVEWNASDVAYPSWCLHEKFEAQVAATPWLVAAQLDADTVTYAELNAQANRIARRLRELGVGPEVLVGICMDRSLRRLAGLLGILKAGGGYVPLDPQYPRLRLSFLMRDADIAVVLTDDASEPALPAESATVLSLDRDWDVMSTLDGSNIGTTADPSNVAYVIYTSGSTGQPKGVVVEHRQAVNFATGEIEHWPLGPADRIVQFASLNFDVSVLDIFGALLSGATLVLGTSDMLLSPPRLAELIRRERITFMCLPPAVLNLLADQEFPALRVVLAGGEAFSSALVRAWARPGMRFINAYGPTETTVGATMAECRDDGIDPPPIGLPLPNYKAYVLDRQLNPVPVGVAGELHLGGAGVARGYLNRPELTAERFIPDPFSADATARLYKTGDIACRLPDGNLQFLGRFDDQVKIRGLRVEPGEIEAVLADHPAVAQTVVVVGADRTGQKQLVGYARLEPGAPATAPTDLRVYLAGRLPAYMVPAHLMILDEFPLNASRKVDRSALPAPDYTETAATYVAPRTLIETVLVDLYASMLNLDRVGVDDNFFDLGGNSLQVMQMITRLRSDLDVDVDVTAIFLAPTPAQLTAVLRDRHGLPDSNLDEGRLALHGQSAMDRAAEVPDSLVALTAGGDYPPLFCVHAVGGTVYPYVHLAQELSDQVRVYGIQAAGLREGTTPVQTLDDMVDRYVAAVRAVQPVGPYQLAGACVGGLVALEMARRLTESGSWVSLVALLDSPVYPADATAVSESELTALFVADAARTLVPEAGQGPDPTTSSVTEQLDWLVERITDGRGDADAVRAEICRRFDVYKAHTRLIAGYRPAPVDPSTLIVIAKDSVDCAAEWLSALGEHADVLRVPGDHYSFLQPPGVREVAAAVRHRLEDPVPGAVPATPPGRLAPVREAGEDRG